MVASNEDLAPRFPNTRNLKPKTKELRSCCPLGDIFPEHILEQNLVTIPHLIGWRRQNNQKQNLTSRRQ